MTFNLSGQSPDDCPLNFARKSGPTHATPKAKLDRKHRPTQVLCHWYGVTRSKDDKKEASLQPKSFRTVGELACSSFLETGELGESLEGLGDISRCLTWPEDRAAKCWRTRVQR